MPSKYPAIQEPQAEINSVRSTASSTKEVAEMLIGQRGDRTLAAVTWQDLYNLGLITAAQLPKTPSAQ